MIDPVAWDNVADVITPRGLLPSRSPADLHRHRRARPPAKASPCDVVTVSQQLERNGKLESAGGLAYPELGGARYPDGGQRARLRGQSCASARCCGS